MEIVVLNYQSATVDCIKIPEEVADKIDIDNVEEYLENIGYNTNSISFMVGNNIMFKKKRALIPPYVVDYNYLF